MPNLRQVHRIQGKPLAEGAVLRIGPEALVRKAGVMGVEEVSQPHLPQWPVWAAGTRWADGRQGHLGRCVKRAKAHRPTRRTALRYPLHKARAAGISGARLALRPMEFRCPCPPQQPLKT